MKKLPVLTIAIMLAGIGPSLAADWDAYPVPADPGIGMTWELQSISDDFNYSAPANNKGPAFAERWVDRYPNGWQGPGLTDWDPGYSSVEGGDLTIRVARKSGSSDILAGNISSKETIQYPLYIETRAKMNKLVMASAIWMISLDQTEEIDILEAYGSDRPDRNWWAQRLHLSHHVFIRDPFQDYQPTDGGSWYFDGTTWADDYHRIGVYWRDPWHLEYYVDGVHVRTVTSESIIDPNGYTGGTGLSKPMHIVVDTEDQNWLSDNGITPTNAELADNTRNTMRVDWIRVYKPVPKTIGAEITSSSDDYDLLFGEGQPDRYAKVLSSGSLKRPLSEWTVEAEQVKFDASGEISLTLPMSGDRKFFVLETTDPPYSAVFDWEEASGNWWTNYNSEETDNGVTLVSSGRSAAHDGMDGRGGKSGYGFKANYPQDAVDGRFEVRVGGSIVDFSVFSIDVSAEEGSQAGSVYLEGRRDGSVRWTIDPVNDQGFQTYTEATTGDLAQPIDEILWHGPTSDPGGTVWGNGVDNLIVTVGGP